MDLNDILQINENASLWGGVNYGYNLFDLIMERYEGKDKRFLKCEEYIQEMIDVVKEKGPTAIHKDCEQNVKLMKTLIDIFNLRKLDIYWNYEGIYKARTTVPSYMVYGIVNGYSYKKDKKIPLKIKVFMQVDFLKGQFTPAEILSLILHEIGHNFYISGLTIATEICRIILTFGFSILYDLSHSSKETSISDLMNISSKYFPKLSKRIEQVMTLYNNINAFRCAVIGPFEIIYEIITGKRDLFLKDKQIYPLTLFLYHDEKYANQISTKYGYGPDIVSATKKINASEGLLVNKLTKSSPIFEVINDFYLLQMNVLYTLKFEEHPSINVIHTNVSDKLKKDLKSGDYPPEVKKELEEEINKLDKMYDDLFIINQSEQAPHIRKKLMDFVNKIFKGHTDPREILNFYYDNRIMP